MPVGEFIDRKIGPFIIGKRRGDPLPPRFSKEWDVKQDHGSGEEHGKYARAVDSDSIEVCCFIDCTAIHPRVLKGIQITTDELTRDRFWWKP